MASTSYREVSSHSVSGYRYGIRTRTTVGSFSRTNNTVTANDARVDVNITGPSGGWFSDSGSLRGSYTMPGGVERRSNHIVRSGQIYVGSTYSTPAQTFSFSVGANDTSVYTNNGGGIGSSRWGSGQSLGIPSLGAPTGMSVSTSLVTHTTARLHSKVSSWGTNATAGDGARLEYKKSSASTWTNLAYNNPGTHHRDVSGLTPNTKYDLRNYARNGGGKSSGSGIINFYTRSEVFEAGTIDIQAVSYSVTNAKARAGHYTNSNKIQYRKKGDTTWIDSETVQGDTFSITITGLLPSTTYERRFVNTTTAGTTENIIVEFTTLPAAKLVMPDGTVKNAIPRVVHPDGTVKMVKVNHV